MRRARAHGKDRGNADLPYKSHEKKTGEVMPKKDKGVESC